MSQNDPTDQPSRKLPALRGHIPALDGVRGMAILLVMLYHQTVLVPNNRIDSTYQHVLDFGWVGVDLFFVLSGFLITGILDSMKSRPHFFRNFYARRILRIFPLYYLVVFLAFFIIPHAAQLIDAVPGIARHFNPALVQEKLDSFGRVDGQEPWYWLYLSNVIIALRGFKHAILDISWSLAIEEQFYMVWPTIVFLLSRQAMMRFCAVLILFSIAFRSVLLFAFDANPIAVYVLTPGRCDGLAIGSFLALWLHGGGSLHHATIWAKRTLIVLTPAMIGVFALDEIMGWDQRGRYAESSAFGYATQTIGFTILAFIFGALLVLALSPESGAKVPRVFRMRFMCVLGKYSYAIYLFHLPIRAAFRDMVYKPEDFLTIAGSAIPGQIIFYVISSLATLILAMLSWYLFEQPFLKLKRFFPSAPPLKPKERES